MSPSTARLVKALEEAGAPEQLIALAKEDYYHDYKSPLATPIIKLVEHARKYGLETIAQAAIAGEFDAGKAEADEWASSPDGRATFAELMKKKEPR